MAEMAMYVRAETGVTSDADTIRELRKFEEFQNLDEKTYYEYMKQMALGGAVIMERMDRELDQTGVSGSKATKEKVKQAKKEIQKELDGQNGSAKGVKLVEPPPMPADAGSPPVGPQTQAEIGDINAGVRPDRKQVEREAKALERQISRAKQQADPEKQKAQMSQLANKYAREFVEQGITGREEVIDAVYEEMRQSFPNLTRDETMDYISIYGQMKPLTKDQASIILRDLKGQMQQLAKLRDMTAGKAPLRTGIERRVPSDVERRLIQQVEQTKKLGGFVITDPAKQLKTALETAEKRLSDQIKDLEYQIALGEKIVKFKNPSPTNEKIDALKARRDALKKVFDSIFGKPELTDEQRIKAAEKALDKSITEYKRRLAERDFSKKPGSKTPETENLTKLRAERDRLRKEYADANPNDPRLVAARRRLSIIYNALDRGEMPPPPMPKPKPRVSRALQAVRDVIASAQEDLRLSPQKRADALRKSIQRLKDLEAKMIANGAVPPVKERNLSTNAEIQRLLNEKDIQDRRVRHLAESFNKKGVAYFLTESANMVKEVKTIIDQPLMRQGARFAMAHPLRVAKILLASNRAGWSEARTLTEYRRMIESADYIEAKSAGVKFDAVDSAEAAAHQEIFRGQWANKIPGLGRIVKWSKRVYVMQMNMLRMEWYKALSSTMSRNGRPNQVEGQIYANLVNMATGKGTLGGNRDAVLGGLSTALFSPRNWLGNIETALAVPFWNAATRKGTTKRAAAVVGLEYIRMIAGYALIAALLDGIPGIDVGMNPLAADFGWIKAGDSRYDILGGILSTYVLINRLAQGKYVNAKGETHDIVGDKRRPIDPRAFDIITQQFRNKAAPIVGAGLNWLEGEAPFGGGPRNFSSIQGTLGVISDLAGPILPEDIVDAGKKYGLAEGFIRSIPAFSGIGWNDYNAKKGVRQAPRTKPRFRNGMVVAP